MQTTVRLNHRRNRRITLNQPVRLMRTPPNEAPTYEIFRGRFSVKGVSWLESIEGFGAASDRMKEWATQDPGPYFMFCLQTQKVLASIDTSTTAAAEAKKE